MTKQDKPSPSAMVAANREAWDLAAVHHRTHAQYREHLAGFRKGGYSCLDDILTETLGEIGIAGRSVVQLCCNNGREILSVKGLGAGRCLGVDQSAAFLDQAAELAAAGGLDCDFLCRDVYDLPKELDGAFDVVLITIGVFGWMPDLKAFFEMAAGLLAPGGRLVAYEDHPILNMYDDRGEGTDPPIHSYFDKGPWPEASGLDYYGNAQYEAPVNYWISHSLSDIFVAALDQGLTLEYFEEFPHNVGCWEARENQAAQLPLSYLLELRKTAAR